MNVKLGFPEHLILISNFYREFLFSFLLLCSMNYLNLNIHARSRILCGWFVTSAKEIKALERRVFEENNKGKAAAMAVMDELYATDFVVHGSTESEDIHGLKNVKQSMSEYLNAFPDLHYALDDMIVEGDKVVVRCTVTGTHKGEFMGVPPTNKKVKVQAIAIDRVVGGKIVEEWGMSDTLGLMQQLGVVPTPNKGT
jgi:steroid delta-isomerase-like uncharacterized protein